MLINEKGQKEYYSFWMDSIADLENKLKQVHELVSSIRAPVFYYGSAEKLLFKQMKSLGFEIPQTVDVLGLISESIYFPTFTNGLKDICNYLGFSWNDEIGSGLTSIIFRKNWENTGKPKFKRELLAYNKTDCEALAFLTEVILKIVNNEFEVTDISSLKNESAYNWRNTDDYLNDDFSKINKLSYFSYNQDKIYVRTNESSRKSLKRRQKRKKKVTLKYNQLVEIIPKVCPNCKTKSKKNLSNRVKQSSKLVVSIKFMHFGLKDGLSSITAV